MKKIVMSLALAIMVLLMTVSAAGCVKKKSLESLEITSQPTKTVYDAGERFDKAGLEVKAVYSDKSKKVITDYEIDKDELAYGDERVTVSYKKQKAYIDVTVRDNSIYGISVDIPDEVRANVDYSVDVTLAASEQRDYGYERALIFVEVDKPEGGEVSLTATDSLGGTYDVAELGQWGPPSGFSISNDYTATTRFTARFSMAGEYVIRISVHTLDGEGQRDRLIAQREVTVDVSEGADAAAFGPIVGVENTGRPMLMK